MYETLFIMGIISTIIASVFLIATIGMFFGFNIPEIRKEMSGLLEKRQIEEIRKNSSLATKRRGSVNVFEELEKRAKVKKNNTHSLNIATTSDFLAQKSIDVGTSVLNSQSLMNPDFIIEKNIMFVSTNEVV